MNQRLIANAVRMLIGLLTGVGFIALLSVGLARGLVSGRIAGLLIIAFVFVGLPLARFLGRTAVALLGGKQLGPPSPPSDDMIRSRRLRRLKKQMWTYVICLPVALANAIYEHMWWVTIGTAILGSLLIYASIRSIRQLRNGLT